MKPAQWLRFLSMLALSGGGVAVLTRAGFGDRAVYGDAVTIFGSAFASSIAGFAFSALSGAVLFRAGGAPQHVVQVIVLSSIAIQSLSVVSLWPAIRWRPVWPFLGGGALGLPIGLFLLYHVPASTYLRVLGVFLLGYGTYMLFRRPLVLAVDARTGAALDMVVGVLGGITGGFAGFPGAFVTIWCSLRGWDKVRQRTVFQPFILIMQLATLALLGASATLMGQPTPLVDLTAFAYVPAALSGAYLGMRLFHQLSDRQFGRILSLMLIASGLGLTSVR